MISYHDMTFCPFYADCADGHDCPRALTPEVLAEAARWWGDDGAPICRYSCEPECYKSNGKEKG